MLYIVDYLKAFACFLIVNFHLDILFPDRLALLAFGGDIGNNMFFMISGFTLYPSIEKTECKQIGRWYEKRLKRLLPLLFLFYFFSIFVGDIKISNAWDIITSLIFPTIYWFTGAIILFYPLLFIIEKMCPPIVRRIGFVFLIIMHLLFDGLVAERYFIGFIAMTVGYSLRRHFEEHNTLLIKKRVSFLFSTLLSWTAYIVFKLIHKNWISSGVIHLGIGLMTICIAVLPLAWGYLNNEALEKFSLKNQKFYNTINTLSKMTLVVYLIQVFHGRLIIRFIQAYIPFPVSYVFSLIAISSLASIIFKACQFIKKWMDCLWRYRF